MDELYDVIIAGGGPAGLSAAIYLARAKYRVLVIEKEKFGGQITITEEIVNYPGVLSAGGKELTERMRRQAESFGAEFLLGQVTELELEEDVKQLQLADGRQFQTLGIVLALGASPRKIGFAGEKEFQGRGVAYCATCDGEFFTGREVLVIGGGFAAVQESIFLTKYASRITIIVREEDFTCAAGVSEKLKDYADIEVRFHTEVTEVGGDGVLRYAKLRDNQSGEETTYQAKDGGNIGVFVFAGYEPATAWLKDKVKLNDGNYIITDENRKTNVDGVYAAGDVCIKNLRQVVTAVADGAIAATSLEEYVSEVRDRLHLPKRREVSDDRGGRKNTDEGGAGERRNADGIMEGGGFLDGAMVEQLRQLFEKFQEPVTVAVVKAQDKAAEELEGFARELEGIHPKVTVAVEQGKEEKSYLDLRRGTESVGIRYFSVPGGHEFNSFAIALYNVAGPGQPMDQDSHQRLSSVSRARTLQVMTTLSCTNCPEVVMATQKIASVSPWISAEMYDLSKFPEIKEQYQIMAVPCLIIDGKEVHFGKKNLKEIEELICKT